MAEEAVAEATQETKQAADETVTDAAVTEETTLATGEAPKEDGGTLVSDAPEATVEISLEMPEDALLDADAQTAVIDFATEHKLNNEQAQAIAERDNQALLNQADDLIEGAKQLREDWRKETESDPEIGGSQMSETTGLAKQGLSQVEGGVELAKLLNETGYGNHKSVVKFLRGVGKMFSNDNLPDGKEVSGEKSIEDLFYNNTTEE